MELKPTYNKKGEQRAYYIGDDGREYFMYKDKRTGYIIREMSKDDIDDWFETMKCENPLLSPMQKAISKALVAQQVEKMIEEDSFEKTFLIINPKNEIIGSIDFTECKEQPGKANIEISLRDKRTVELKRRKIIELIKRMIDYEKVYDELWIESTDHDMMRIA